MRPDPTRVSGWRVFIHNLLSLPPRGRLFIRLFYNVISTEVRTIVRTKRRNPPRERYLFVYTSSVFPSGRLPRRFAPRNDSGVKGVRLVCYPCSGVIVPIVWASLGGEPPRASWLARVRFRHFPSGRLPRRCHLPARSIVGPLWLKTVTCGLFLRCFAPPRRAPRGKALKR